MAYKTFKCNKLISLTKTQGNNSKTQTDAVILEVCVIDKQQYWTEEKRDKRPQAKTLANEHAGFEGVKFKPKLSSTLTEIGI